MPEHQQIQQSTESKTTIKKQENPAQTTPIKQTPFSHPVAIIQRARINPKSLTHADIMQLQRTIGNRAVGKLLTEIGLIPSKAKQASPVQMQIIPEEEKDPLLGKMTETVQRQEIPEPEEEELLQGKFENKPEQEICPSCSAFPGQRDTENRTGMPDNIKAGVESLSGIDMSDVRVHYNSSKPEEVGALAYTQGTNIHVAPGQERHLPHEAWHVVQQAQGRVRPTFQMKGLSVNDDKELEREADAMGGTLRLFKVEADKKNINSDQWNNNTEQKNKLLFEKNVQLMRFDSNGNEVFSDECSYNTENLTIDDLRRLTKEVLDRMLQAVQRAAVLSEDENRVLAQIIEIQNPQTSQHPPVDEAASRELSEAAASRQSKGKTTSPCLVAPAPPPPEYMEHLRKNKGLFLLMSLDQLSQMPILHTIAESIKQAYNSIGINHITIALISGVKLVSKDTDPMEFKTFISVRGGYTKEEIEALGREVANKKRQTLENSLKERYVQEGYVWVDGSGDAEQQIISAKNREWLLFEGCTTSNVCEKPSLGIFPLGGRTYSGCKAAIMEQGMNLTGGNFCRQPGREEKGETRTSKRREFKIYGTRDIVEWFFRNYQQSSGQEPAASEERIRSVEQLRDTLANKFPLHPPEIIGEAVELFKSRLSVSSPIEWVHIKKDKRPSPEHESRSSTTTTTVTHQFPTQPPLSRPPPPLVISPESHKRPVPPSASHISGLNPEQAAAAARSQEQESSSPSSEDESEKTPPPAKISCLP